MSTKVIVVAAVLGAAGWALTRNAPPIPVDATAADSAAVSQASIGARLQFGVGMLGGKIVGSTVRNTVHNTETSLRDLAAAIKSTRGGNGQRAKAYAAKVVRMDSIALVSLQYGHPVTAVKAAMEAKSVLGAVRGQVNN